MNTTRNSMSKAAQAERFDLTLVHGLRLRKCLPAVTLRFGERANCGNGSSGAAGSAKTARIRIELQDAASSGVTPLNVGRWMAAKAGVPFSVCQTVRSDVAHASRAVVPTGRQIKMRV